MEKVKPIDKFQFEILDDLVDGLQPFAVLYKDMIRVRGFTNLSIGDLVRTLLVLFQKKLIFCRSYKEDAGYQGVDEIDPAEMTTLYQDYLKTLQLSEITFDELGYYFGITSIGKEVWEDYASRFEKFTIPEKDLWTLDQDNEEKRIIITAKLKAVAEHLLRSWQESNQTKKILPSTVLRKPVPSFRAKYHTEVKGGYEISFKYEILGRRHALPPL